MNSLQSFLAVAPVKPVTAAARLPSSRRTRVSACLAATAPAPAASARRELSAASRAVMADEARYIVGTYKLRGGARLQALRYFWSIFVTRGAWAVEVLQSSARNVERDSKIAGSRNKTCVKVQSWVGSHERAKSSSASAHSSALLMKRLCIWKMLISGGEMTPIGLDRLQGEAGDQGAANPRRPHPWLRASQNQELYNMVCEKNETELDIHIPAVLLPKDAGQAFCSLLTANTSLVGVQLYSPDRPVVDTAEHFISFLLALSMKHDDYVQLREYSLLQEALLIKASSMPHEHSGPALVERATTPQRNQSSSTSMPWDGHIRMYFQVHYTKENLKDYIDPDGDTLKVKLADSDLHANFRIMLGTDKRATITTNWSKFRYRANIREGDICAFRFEVTAKRNLVLIVHRF